MMQDHVSEVVHATTKRFVLPETVLLVTLCTWDMLFTLYCVRNGLAREANPALRRSLQHSNLVFIALKASTFLLPVILLEIIRSKRPEFVTLAMRIGFLTYAFIYISGSIALMGTV